MIRIKIDDLYVHILRYVAMYVCIYSYTNIHTYIHSIYIHPYMHTYMHAVQCITFMVENSENINFDKSSMSESLMSKTFTKCVRFLFAPVKIIFYCGIITWLQGLRNVFITISNGNCAIPISAPFL